MKLYTLKRRDGSVIASRSAKNRKSFIELLSEEDVDMSYANLVGWHMPGLTLKHGTILRHADISDANITMGKLEKCELDNLIQRRTKANGASYKQSLMRWSMAHKLKARGADFEGVTSMESVFDEADLTAISASSGKTNFDGSWFVNTIAREMHAHGASFRRSHFVGTDLRGAKVLVPRGVNYDNNPRFKDAIAIGCIYGEGFEAAEREGVQVFHKDAKQIKRVRHAAEISCAVGFGLAVDRVSDGIRELVHSIPALDPTSATTASAATAAAAALAGIGVFGVTVAMDIFKEHTTEEAVGLSGRLARTTVRALTAMEGYGRDRRNLVVLAGSKRSMQPLRIALLATRMAWRAKLVSDEQRTQHKAPFWNRWMGLATATGRIIICDKDHLAEALRMLRHAHAHDGFPAMDTVMIRPNAMEGDGAPASLTIGHKGSLKAVWNVPGGFRTVYYPLTGEPEEDDFPNVPGEECERVQGMDVTAREVIQNFMFALDMDAPEMQSYLRHEAPTPPQDNWVVAKKQAVRHSMHLA